MTKTLLASVLAIAAGCGGQVGNEAGPDGEEALSNCSFSVSGVPSEVPGTGGTYTATVTTGKSCLWTASGSTSWLTAHAVLTGNVLKGSGSVTITVQHNGTNLRAGTVAIADKTFTVNQDADESLCEYWLSQPGDPIRRNATITFGPQGGSGTISVNTNGDGCDWSLAPAQSGYTLPLTIGPDSGRGAGTLSYQVPAWDAASGSREYAVFLTQTLRAPPEPGTIPLINLGDSYYVIQDAQ